MNIVASLLVRRYEKKLSIGDVSIASGVPSQMIEAMERGNLKLDMSAICAIASALDMEIIACPLGEYKNLKETYKSFFIY